MSDIDLSAAVEAAARAGYEAVDITGVPWSARRAEGNVFRYGKEIRRAEAAVTAAAPLIEAQVRERVAQEIEAERAECVATFDDKVPYDRAVLYSLAVAARIARGGAR